MWLRNGGSAEKRRNLWSGSSEDSLRKEIGPMRLNNILDVASNPLEDILDKGRWFKKSEETALERQL